MPPKPKYTKQEIIYAAFELTRERGIKNLVARELGKKLGTSATPIFTYFDGMNELKSEVRAVANQRLIEYMDGIFDYWPAFKEFGMRWIRFANEEPYLYELILRDDEDRLKDFEDILREYHTLVDGLSEQISQSFNINLKNAQSLFRNMMIYANGIAGFSEMSESFRDEDRLAKLIGKVCISLAMGYAIQEGTFNPEVAKMMLDEKNLAAKPKKGTSKEIVKMKQEGHRNA